MHTLIMGIMIVSMPPKKYMGSTHPPTIPPNLP